MYRTISYYALGCFMLWPAILLAQMSTVVDWHLVKNENGIEVYTAPSPSGYKHIKVSASLEGTLAQVSRLFRNIPLENQWVYGTKRSYLIRKTDDEHLLYYNETSLPW